MYFYRSKAYRSGAEEKNSNAFLLQTQKFVECWGWEEGFTGSVLLKHLQAFCFALVM